MEYCGQIKLADFHIFGYIAFCLEEDLTLDRISDLQVSFCLTPGHENVGVQTHVSEVMGNQGNVKPLTIETGQQFVLDALALLSTSDLSLARSLTYDLACLHHASWKDY